MKIGKWHVYLEVSPIINANHKWLYRWHLNIIFLHLWLSDLSGSITILNLKLGWEKRFK